MAKELNQSNGFTLVELLVTIGVLGILFTLAMANAKSIRDAGVRAVAVKTNNDLRTATYAFREIAPEDCDNGFLQLLYYFNPPPNMGTTDRVDAVCHNGSGSRVITNDWVNFLGEAFTSPAQGSSLHKTQVGLNAVFTPRANPASNAVESTTIVTGNCDLDTPKFYRFFRYHGPYEETYGTSDQSWKGASYNALCDDSGGY